MNKVELPPYCYSVDLVTQELIKVKKGETGFYPQHPTKEDCEKFHNNMELMAESLNGIIGVSKRQRIALVNGSHFGFHIPAANPNNWNDAGEWIG